MQRDAQIGVIRTLLDHLDRREPVRAPSTATVPAAHYTSREHLARERSTVLHHWPQLIALSCDLPRPGSQVVRPDLAVPVVLTRDTDAVVHALVNVCRHRGARVVEADATSRRLTCPYHAWSYHLDGTLAAVPDATSFPGVTSSDCRLPALPTIEWGGMIWIVPDANGPVQGAMPPDSLGAIADDLCSYQLDSFQHWRSHRFELHFNWKLVIDTFLEPYHFASLHRTSVGPIFVPNLCVAERFGSHVREVLPRRSIAGLADLPPGEWDLVAHSAIVFVLFPNAVVVMQSDHLETWRVYPDRDDPSRAVCELDFYLPGDGLAGDGAEQYWQRNWDLTINTVIHEDFAVMAGVQANLASGQLDHLTFGRNEPALAHYHQALAEAM